MTKTTPEIMRTIGQIVAAIYGPDVPVNVQNTILRYPIRGIGLISSRGDFDLGSEEIARLMNKIPSDLEDPKDQMSFDCQGAFWIGYYQYSKLKDDVKNYTPSHLSIIGEALYGNQWQTNLTRDLNLSDARRVRQWMAGERKIPIGVWSDIADLLKSKQKRIEEILSEIVEMQTNQEMN